jgi:hypothetical protein
MTLSSDILYELNFNIILIKVNFVYKSFFIHKPNNLNLIIFSLMNDIYRNRPPCGAWV